MIVTYILCIFIIDVSLLEFIMSYFMLHLLKIIAQFSQWENLIKLLLLYSSKLRKSGCGGCSFVSGNQVESEGALRNIS